MRHADRSVSKSVTEINILIGDHFGCEGDNDVSNNEGVNVIIGMENVTINKES